MRLAEIKLENSKDLSMIEMCLSILSKRRFLEFV